MTKDLLKDRERGEEADFFKKQDAKLIGKIRERAHLEEVARALAEKLSVDDPALLERVAGFGLTRESGPAILLAPLIQVAWADGGVTPREREVVMEIAASRGVAPGTPPHDQLLAWLKVRPPVGLFDVAMELLCVGYDVLPPAERAERIRELFDGCERVAEASGGLAKLIGLSSGVSGDESALLDEFRRKLGAPKSSA